MKQYSVSANREEWAVRSLAVIKATEFAREEVPWQSFAEALEDGVLGVTPDAVSVLQELDNEARGLPKVPQQVRYVLLTVEEKKDVRYISRFGHKLLYGGWTVFLDYQSFLSFVCGEFRKILPLSCAEVSIPLRVGGKLRPINFILEREMPVIDAHPTVFSSRWLGLPPVEKHDNILILR